MPYLPRILSKFGLVFFCCLFFLISTTFSFADTPTPGTSNDQCNTAQQFSKDGVDDVIEMTPPSQCINEALTKGVTLRFNKINASLISKDFWLCRNAETDLSSCSTTSDYFKKSAYKSFFVKDGDGTYGYSVTLCAGDDKTLTENCSSNDKNIYFRAGSIYNATLLSDSAYQAKKNKDVPGTNDETTYAAEALFQVAHYAPTMTVVPNDSQSLKPDTSITVTLDGPNPRKKGGDANNNYQIVLSGTNVNYESKECVVVTDNPQNPPVNQVTFNKLPEGQYNIDIWEQINEGRNALGISGGVTNSEGNYNNIQKRGNCDGGDNDYARRVLTIGKNGGSLGPQINDPLANDNSLSITPVPPPCQKFEDMQGHQVTAESDNAVKCVEVNSAIGTLYPDPAKFITRLFSFLLGISGGIALFIIIFSGYRLMTSQGKPETIQQARETMTSAIVGLLFMIFSLVILQIIGVDILHIPSFGQ